MRESGGVVFCCYYKVFLLVVRVSGLETLAQVWMVTHQNSDKAILR